MQEAPIAVLDTNVVLDWLVFRNPNCATVGAAIENGRLHWVVTPSIRAELAHVLARGVLKAWAPDEAALWQAWDRLSKPAELVALHGEALKLRCSDPDDQKFVDLALGHAHWLFSRDRAVLKLARRAARLGLQVLSPERWSP